MRRRRGVAVITALAALGAGSAWLTWQKNTPEASEGATQLSGRRQALSTATAGAASLTERAEAAEAETEQPLTYCGGGFCTSFSLGGRQFRGVVDTGSPFLLVSTCEDGRGASGRSCSSYCSAWGCTTAAKGRPSGLEDTDECFAAGTARVSWRKDSLELGGRPFGSITYGVMLEVESYGGNGGGAFLGLVRDRQARIRPTLVGQTDVRTLSIDLRAGQESLSFSQKAPQKGDGAMVPLVDLRGSGAAVRYYAAEVAALNVGGKPLEVEGPLVAVLDTGTTGLGLPSALFARYDAQRRERAEELGLKAGQAVEILLKAADGGVLPLSLRQGRQAPYESDRFDIVTAIPEPPGIAPDALALWTGDPVGAKRLALREGDLVAEAMEVRASQRGWVQADRPVSQGDRFLVRLVGRTAGRRLMDAAVGLAPRGSRLTAEESAAFPGELQSGDLVECLLSDDGSGRVLWRINGGKAVYSSQPFETARNVYPTVELGPGAGSVELLSAPAGNSFDEGLGRWARPPSEARARPTVLFLGLGFLLGRKLSIDTVANRAVFM